MGFDLRLMSIESLAELPPDGRDLVIVSIVRGRLHLRQFDENGMMIHDKGEDVLGDTDQVIALKALVASHGPNPVLSAAEKENLVRSAISALPSTNGNITSPSDELGGWTQEEMDAARPFPLPEIPDDD